MKAHRVKDRCQHAHVTKPNLDGLSSEAKNVIFQILDLDTCLALSQSSKAWYTLWTGLDASLVRNKVLQRAPWFKLNESETGLRSWDLCARVLLDRTRRARENAACKLINDLQGAVAETNEVKASTYDITIDRNKLMRMDETSPSPLFPDAEIQCQGGRGTMKGTNLQFSGMQMDFLTLQAEPSVKDKKVDKFSRLVVSCESVTVVAENDNLLLFKVNQNHRLVHKDQCRRDYYAYYVNDDDLTLIEPQDYGKAIIKLLPGSGGALITKFIDSKKVSSYIAYIEPTVELKHIFLCTIPSMRLSKFYPDEATQPDNYLCYNGYLYIYFEGYLVPLWVDLGFQKMKYFKYRGATGHDLLKQSYDTQALTAAPKIPVMRLAAQSEKFASHKIMQATRGLDRYVTCDAGCGYYVGDLLTGMTYTVNDASLVKDGLCIPFISNKNIIFLKVSRFVLYRLTLALERLDKDKTASMVDDYELDTYDPLGEPLLPNVVDEKTKLASFFPPKVHRDQAGTPWPFERFNVFRRDYDPLIYCPVSSEPFTTLPALLEQVKLKPPAVSAKKSCKQREKSIKDFFNPPERRIPPSFEELYKPRRKYPYYRTDYDDDYGRRRKKREEKDWAGAYYFSNLKDNW